MQKRESVTDRSVGMVRYGSMRRRKVGEETLRVSA